MLRNKYAKVVLRVLSSWKVVRGRLWNARYSLFKYSTSFSLWSGFLLIPLLSSYPDLTLPYTMGDLVTRLSLSVLTHSHNYSYEYLLFCHNESCIVLVSNHYCTQMSFKVGTYLLPFKITTVPWRIRPWWTKLWGPQSYSQWPFSYFVPALPTLKVLNVTNKNYVCMVKGFGV